MYERERRIWNLTIPPVSGTVSVENAYRDGRTKRKKVVSTGTMKKKYLLFLFIGFSWVIRLRFILAQHRSDAPLSRFVRINSISPITFVYKRSRIKRDVLCARLSFSPAFQKREISCGNTVTPFASIVPKWPPDSGWTILSKYTDQVHTLSNRKSFFFTRIDQLSILCINLSTDLRCFSPLCQRGFAWKSVQLSFNCAQ